MTFDNQAVDVMDVLAGIFKNDLDRIRELLSLSHRIGEVASGLNHELLQVRRLHQTLRIRAQFELWESQGKRLCPRCMKPRGSKTFRWLYLERKDHKKPSRILVFCCRKCQQETRERTMHPYGFAPYNYAEFAKRIEAIEENGGFFLFNKDGEFVAIEAALGVSTAPPFEVIREAKIGMLDTHLLTIGSELEVPRNPCY